MTEPAKMIAQIKSSGMSMKAIASHIGQSESTVYKLSSHELVKVSAEAWEKLKELHSKLKTAGLIV